MRGKDGNASRSRGCGRITPAYAGKSDERRRPCADLRDHPRVCGEKCSSKLFVKELSGSPPRMRGKVGAVFGKSGLNGITPAYAGKRGSHCGSDRRLWDHPRVCGEKYFTNSALKSKAGSPPRMRGKVQAHATQTLPEGITPAYAGKRRGCHRRCSESKDHPRVCGEKTKKIP